MLIAMGNFGIFSQFNGITIPVQFSISSFCEKEKIYIRMDEQ